MNFYDKSCDQDHKSPCWSFDLDYPGKNFWDRCPMCNCDYTKMGGCRNGRIGSALCNECWVFMQGIMWFAPLTPMPRPDANMINAYKQQKKMQKQLSQ